MSEFSVEDQNIICRKMGIEREVLEYILEDTNIM